VLIWSFGCRIFRVNNGADWCPVELFGGRPSELGRLSQLVSDDGQEQGLPCTQSQHTAAYLRWQGTSVIFINENENGEKRENKEFVNEN